MENRLRQNPHGAACAACSLSAFKDGINEAFYEELEEALILADAGAATTERLLDGLPDRNQREEDK